MQIKWSDIEAEAQGFRQGFVAVFRKYEGQETDEKDGNGITVKVTAASFARHMGIAKTTFNDWLNQEADARTPARTEKQFKGDVTRAARQAPQAIVEAINELPEEQADEIVRQLHVKRLERAGADFSEQGRKEREARTHEVFEPMLETLRGLQIVSAIEKVAAMLRGSSPSEEELVEIDAALEDLTLARHEVAFRMEDTK